MVALVVQSLTESRILIESGWLLLVLLAAKSRFDFELPSLDAEPQRVPWRQVPIPRDHAPALAASGAPSWALPTLVAPVAGRSRRRALPRLGAPHAGHPARLGRLES